MKCKVDPPPAQKEKDEQAMLKAIDELVRLLLPYSHEERRRLINTAAIFFNIE